MKIRNGFVSNSSSSSFVVAFPKIPKSVEEVQEILFGKEEKFHEYTTKEVAETIFNEISGDEYDPAKKPNDVIELRYAQSSWPHYDEDECCACKCHFNEPVYVERLQGYVEKDIYDLMQKNPDTFLYVFRFADEDGNYFGTLEHCGVFEKLPHIRYSHH